MTAKVKVKYKLEVTLRSTMQSATKVKVKYKVAVTLRSTMQSAAPVDGN